MKYSMPEYLNPKSKMKSSKYPKQCFYFIFVMIKFKPFNVLFFFPNPFLLFYLSICIYIFVMTTFVND